MNTLYNCVFLPFSGQGVSLNATLGEFDQQVNPVDYTDDLGDVERGYQQEGGEYVDEYSLPNDMEIPDGQMEYSGEQAGGDGVLDIQINEPLDDEFQVSHPPPPHLPSFCLTPLYLEKITLISPSWVSGGTYQIYSGGAKGDACWVGGIRFIITLRQLISPFADKVGVDSLFGGR